LKGRFSDGVTQVKHRDFAASRCQVKEEEIKRGGISTRRKKNSAGEKGGGAVEPSMTKIAQKEKIADGGKGTQEAMHVSERGRSKGRGGA